MMFVCKDCRGELISPPDHATFGEAEYCFDEYWWCPKCHHKDPVEKETNVHSLVTEDH